MFRLKRSSSEVLTDPLFVFLLSWLLSLSVNLVLADDSSQLTTFQLFRTIPSIALAVSSVALRIPLHVRVLHGFTDSALVSEFAL